MGGYFLGGGGGWLGFLVLFCFWDKVTLCSSGWPWPSVILPSERVGGVTAHTQFDFCFYISSSILYIALHFSFSRSIPKYHILNVWAAGRDVWVWPWDYNFTYCPCLPRWGGSCLHLPPPHRSLGLQRVLLHLTLSRLWGSALRSSHLCGNDLYTKPSP